MQFVAGIDPDAFRRDVEKVYAMTRALAIIGEGARQMPAAARAAYPELPWQDMIGMRNVVAHGYFGVDPDVLWRTVREDLPPLAEAVRANPGSRAQLCTGFRTGITS